jgi:sugar phosphate isomerase/epimerase
MMSLSRRELMAGLAGAAAATLKAETKPDAHYAICAYSKHWQWTDVKETAEIAARMGYDGIDLTVRKGGHVLPERVADDLPKAEETIRKAGMKLTMITGDIEDTQSPYCENVLKTLAKLGVRWYRWGNLRYDLTKSIAPQLAGFQARAKDLAAMNKEYGVCAIYHTHSGVGWVGASIWDLYLILKDLDPNAVAVNYDVGHATVEGGLGGWIHSANLTMPMMKGVAVKDFNSWARNAKGVWMPGWCELGQGQVNFKQFFPMLKAARFTGPLQLHMEYPDLGGADTGKTKLTIPKEQLLAIMQRNLDTLKRLLREADFA